MMRSYAQTYIQLFNQLRREGYSQADAALIRDAYEFAMSVFTARFQPSGKSYMAHVVGTASILASLHSPARVVAAGLVHNIYTNGDFGDGAHGVSDARRREIREALGPEIETYAAKFQELYWEPRITEMASRDPDRLDPTDRDVLLILFAEHLEHLLDADVLYSHNDFYLRQSKIVTEIAESMGLGPLAAEFKEAIRAVESFELPVDLSRRGAGNDSPVVTPASCRMKLSIAAPPLLNAWASGLRRQSLNSLNLFYERSPSPVKTIYRALKREVARWRGNRKSLAVCLKVKSEAFRSLFPKGATLQRVATGFRFTEGPVWIEEQRNLLFSDIPANRILRLKSDGRTVTFREPSGNSNGLTRDKEGRLIACEQGTRRVTRTEKDGSIKILADKFQGKKLNSPNDVVVKSDGAIYFSDPSYGIEPDEQEQPVQGVYRLSPDGKELSLVAGDLARPNGLGFSPDESKLYIDDSERRHVRVFNVEHNGSLSGGSIFHDMNVSIPGAPDGMKVDVEGHVYCTGAGGVWVFDAQGKHLGTIVTPEKPSNCAWGDDDWRSLYITAVTSVYKIRVNIPGIKVP